MHRRDVIEDAGGVAGALRSVQHGQAAAAGLDRRARPPRGGEVQWPIRAARGRDRGAAGAVRIAAGAGEVHGPAPVARGRHPGRGRQPAGPDIARHAVQTVRPAFRGRAHQPVGVVAEDRQQVGGAQPHAVRVQPRALPRGRPSFAAGDDLQLHGPAFRLGSGSLVHCCRRLPRAGVRRLVRRGQAHGSASVERQREVIQLQGHRFLAPVDDGARDRGAVRKRAVQNPGARAHAVEAPAGGRAPPGRVDLDRRLAARRRERRRGGPPARLPRGVVRGVRRRRLVAAQPHELLVQHGVDADGQQDGPRSQRARASREPAPAGPPAEGHGERGAAGPGEPRQGDDGPRTPARAIAA